MHGGGQLTVGISLSPRWLRARSRAGRQRPAISGPAHPHTFMLDAFSRTLPGPSTPSRVCPSVHGLSLALQNQSRDFIPGSKVPVLLLQLLTEQPCLGLKFKLFHSEVILILHSPQWLNHDDPAPCTLALSSQESPLPLCWQDHREGCMKVPSGGFPGGARGVPMPSARCFLVQPISREMQRCFSQYSSLTFFRSW